MDGDATRREAQSVDSGRREERMENGQTSLRANEQDEKDEGGKRKKLKVAELWGKLELDLGTGLMMMKY